MQDPTQRALAIKKEHDDNIASITEPIIEGKYKMVPLNLAEKYIIPYYLGKVDKEENNQSFIDNMLTITGSYHIGLKVTEDGHNEPVLYILPPLIGSLSKNLDVGKHLERYRHMRDNNPAKADHLLRTKLSSATDDIVVSERETYAMNIQKLRADYGVTPTSATTAEDEVDEEELYDW